MISLHTTQQNTHKSNHFFSLLGFSSHSLFPQIFLSPSSLSSLPILKLIPNRFHFFTWSLESCSLHPQVLFGMKGTSFCYTGKYFFIYHTKYGCHSSGLLSHSLTIPTASQYFELHLILFSFPTHESLCYRICSVQGCSPSDWYQTPPWGWTAPHGCRCPYDIHSTP
jgi:hypothetical protein